MTNFSTKQCKSTFAKGFYAFFSTKIEPPITINWHPNFDKVYKKLTSSLY